MKIETILTEAFNKALPFKKIGGTKYYFENIDGMGYHVLFTKESINVGGGRISSFDLSFLSDSGFETTGKSFALPVFSTILKIIEDFISTMPRDSILTFQAMDDSLERLYRRMFDTLTRGRQELFVAAKIIHPSEVKADLSMKRDLFLVAPKSALMGNAGDTLVELFGHLDPNGSYRYRNKSGFVKEIQNLF